MTLVRGASSRPGALTKLPATGLRNHSQHRNWALDGRGQKQAPGSGALSEDERSLAPGDWMKALQSLLLCAYSVKHHSSCLCLFCCQHTDGDAILHHVEVPTAVKASCLCFGGNVKKSVVPGVLGFGVQRGRQQKVLDPKNVSFQWDLAGCNPMRK
ncbi:unnamed protein product [Rangifer tarandus platyrhynchus]|uniref:Uncharacterized protein n=1 Tax=Rangifer tarandus platyrhynchus TaxID=3082113 RepID=A0AC59Z0Y0_RANTA